MPRRQCQYSETQPVTLLVELVVDKSETELTTGTEVQYHAPRWRAE
jgi:hypothetical protein